MINEWSIASCQWQWIDDSLYASVYLFDDSEHVSNIKSIRWGYSFSQDRYSDFLFFKFDYVNKSENNYDSVYLGLYMDFNVTNLSHTDDYCGYVDSLKLAYFHDIRTPSEYIGMKILCEVPNMGASFHWPEDMPFYDSTYYCLLSDLNVPPSIPDTAGSYAILFRSGPYQLNYLDSLNVFYGVVAGADFQELILNAVTMQSLFDSVFASVEEPTQPIFQPNIFIVQNPSSGMVKIRFSHRANSLGSIRLFDLCGRELEFDFHFLFREGLNEFDLCLSSVPSGSYFLSLTSENIEITKRITIIK
ncbi:T9SS type A sorting domain-containing protein [candidate division WOR-3 bacterium]|nr:T9SS type A sorting domain-containing protein [candidate division WOR-3 bacterium]